MFASMYAKEHNDLKTLEHIQYVIENLIKILKGELEKESEYEFLKDDDRFKELIKRLESLV